MKRKLVLSSALVLLVALMAWSTWAYFTASARTTNVITTGTIQITLKDKINDPQATQTENGWELTGVMPGVAVEKTVFVTNDEADTAGDAWVRVKVTTTITGAEDKDNDGAKDSLPTTFPRGQKTLDAVEIGFDTIGEDAKWIEEKDATGAPTGYYYYKTPLTRGEKTSYLFSTVTLNKYLPNEYQGCTVNIAVSAQAVQVKNNNTYKDANDEDVKLTELTEATVKHITGWPES